MPLEIIRNDITNMHVDAIVNTANPLPVVGSGVDSGIHRKAGNELLDARKEIGILSYGDVAITPAFALDARYVIHAVTPVWQEDTGNERLLLEDCYRKSLQLAREYSCKSIAFPLLSTGNQGFPKDLALQIALNVFNSFLMQYEMQIYLVVFDHASVGLSEKLFQSVKRYIDEMYVAEKLSIEYPPESIRKDNVVKKRSAKPVMQKYNTAAASTDFDIPSEAICQAPSIYTCQSPRKLEDLMNELDETFSESLIRLIDQKGLKDTDVYKKANVDRKLFSKIKNNKNYKPSKSTALAFAIALELSLDETLDFIGRAGYTLSHSSKFDIIIEYFLLEGIYDIFEINGALFAFEQPTLA